MRVKVAAEDVVGMSLQGLHTLARGELPNFERLVVGGGDEEPRVARPSHVGDAQTVTGNGLLKLAVVGAPDFDKLVGRGRSQPFAVGGKLDGRDGLRVAGQGKLERVIGLGGRRRVAGAGGSRARGRCGCRA